MKPLPTFVMTGLFAAALSGCVPIAVAALAGALADDGAGLPAAGDGNSPFATENPLINEQTADQIFDASQAKVVDACRRRLTAEEAARPPPGQPRDASDAAAERRAERGNCVIRKVCLPGHRTPVDLLVCRAGAVAKSNGVGEGTQTGGNARWGWSD